MNRHIAVIAFLFLAGFGTVGAGSQGLSTSPLKCPHGTSYVNSRGDTDGCLTAPAGAPNNVTLFQRPNFFTGYAAQSGQTYKIRPPWNVAGVDYPVGIPAGTVLKDLANAMLPLGCSYSKTGNSLGGPMVTCAKSGVDLAFDAFDWSGTIVNPGSHGCVDFDPPATPTKITFTRNYFATNSACFGKSNQGYAVQLFTGTATTNWENNVFDFSPAKTGAGSGFMPISLGAGPCATFKYNAFINIPQNPVNGNAAAGCWLFAYNYVENYVFDVSNQNHAEVANISGNGSPAFTIYEFNTVLRGRNNGIGSGTATFRISNQVGGPHTFLDAEILNNVAVHNLNSGQIITNVGLADMNNTQTATKIEDNFVDKTGARYYAEAENVTACVVPMMWSKNYDLVGGSVVDVGSTPITGGLFITGTTPISGAGSCK
jgi:hypothetical protein